MNYYIHDSQGKITRVGMCQAEVAHLYAKEGETMVEGVAGPTDYVDTASGALTALPAQPSAYHRFDYAVKQWVLDVNLAGQSVRQLRDQLIAKSDWTTLADVPLSEQARLQWAAYRQALRDVTSQAGFPQHVVWPPPPG